MSDYKNTFKRFEKKYMLNEEHYRTIMKLLEKEMSVDKFGLSKICNIYYDTENFDLVRTSIEKPLYKEKLRLRSYGVPDNDSSVFLEIKKKYKGVVYKRRASLSLKEAEDFTLNLTKPQQQEQIINELEWFIRHYHPLPKVFLAYDRIALSGKEDPELRITFDSDIRWRDTDLFLSAGDYGSPVIDKNTYLMEIKIAGAMPLWLCHILGSNEIYPVSFSKYGTCYTNNIIHEYLIGGVNCA